MTPLMMLALTLPPSLAFVLERWMAGREAQARKLAAEQVARIDKIDRDLGATCEVVANLNAAHGAAQAELKKLTEQVSLLADRYR